MESPANARPISQSKKKVFPGSTSSSSMEPEVIEVAPPSADQLAMIAKRKAKGKRKQLAFHEIIDGDMNEDRDDDVVFIERKAESNKKGKRSTGISLGSSNATKLVSKKVESNKKGKEIVVEPGHRFTPGSKNFIDLDDYVSDDDFPTLQAYFNSINDLPTGIEAPIPWLPDSVGKKKKTRASPLVTSHAQVEASQNQQNGVDPLSTSTLLPSSKKDPGVHPQPRSTYFGSSSTTSKCDNDHVQKKYESFKKFDIVVDYSDHLYAKKASAFKPQKNWAKKIQDEWKILEKDLPDTIFVRAYESRMDLLRAAVIGAEGTPYHDGLFFFDVCFPSGYPKSPPLVLYHSGGLRINPNLYESGKVCLSLLNTWPGRQKEEQWIPGTSTMLQVLVSIQGLILNTKPYFNEPGLASLNGSVRGETPSLQYNESTLILSLKTMVYTMNKPPKNFEDLVLGHFCNHVRDILMACKSYTEGVQVGCLVKGNVQDVEGKSSCSTMFRTNVASYVKTLIAAFNKIGAKGTDEFIPLTEKISPLLNRAPHSHPWKR